MQPGRGYPVGNLHTLNPGNAPGPNASLPFLYYNAGKRGIVLDLGHAAAREAFLRLCRTADLLFDSCTPGYLDELGLSYAEFSR